MWLLRSGDERRNISMQDLWPVLLPQTSQRRYGNFKHPTNRVKMHIIKTPGSDNIGHGLTSHMHTPNSILRPLQHYKLASSFLVQGVALA